MTPSLKWHFFFSLFVFLFLYQGKGCIFTSVQAVAGKAGGTEGGNEGKMFKKVSTVIVSHIISVHDAHDFMPGRSQETLAVCSCLIIVALMILNVSTGSPRCKKEP